jgi:hypothetical protein
MEYHTSVIMEYGYNHTWDDPILYPQQYDITVEKWGHFFLWDDPSVKSSHG